MAETASTEFEIPWAHVRCIQHLVGRSSGKRPTGPVELPVKILPWLYLSDERSARDGQKLSSVGATHVLSLNGMPSASAKAFADALRQAGIVHCHLNGNDEEGYDMIGRHWDECYEFLSGVRESGGVVVVNCAAGLNRSALIVCAGHLVFERKPVLEVVEHCVKARGGEVLSNQSFQVQLCTLASREGLLGEKPQGYTDEPLFLPRPFSKKNRLAALDNLSKLG